MPRISFLNLVNYLEKLATSHLDIKDTYRWNISEVSERIRSGISLPVMIIDAVETNTIGDNTKTIHVHTTAFTILGKPNTQNGKLDKYQAQNETLDFCQKICFDMEERIINDATSTKDAKGVKNWLYGMVDKNSFHHFKIGPIFSDRLYGYRCEFSLKNNVPLCVDRSKWNDL